MHQHLEISLTRVVAGSLASEAMLGEIEAAFPNVEVYFTHQRRGG